MRLGREETLLVTVQAVNTAFDLSRGGPKLESDLARADGRTQQVQVGDTHVLQRVLETGVEVRQELLDRALVLDGTSDTLGDLDGVALGEVTLGGGVLVSSDLVGLGGSFAGSTGNLVLLLVLHGFDGSHSTVALETLAVAVEVVSGRLGGSGEQTTHHDGASAECHGLGDVTDVGDTTIGNNGDAKLGGELGNSVNSGSLGSANSHHLLGDADGAGTHTDTESVSTSSNEAGGLFTGNNITSDNIDVRESLLDPLDHLDLVNRVALRRVEDDNVETSLDEESKTLSVRGTGTDGSGTVELLALGALGSQGEVLVLEQVGTSEEGNKTALGVDNGELSLLAVTEDSVGLLEGDALLGGDNVGGHHLGKGDGGVTELDVTSSDDTEELAVHSTSVYLSMENENQDRGQLNHSLSAYDIPMIGERERERERGIRVIMQSAHTLPSLRERLGRTKVICNVFVSSFEGAEVERWEWGSWVICSQKTLTSDGDTTETKTFLDLEHVTDGGVGVEAERLGDETVFVLLDLANDASLLLGAHVVVDDTHTTHQTHGDGHLGLGDRVHGRREERSVEGDVLGHLGAEADVGSGEVDESGKNEKVVVSETTVLARVDELGHAKTIASGIGLEVLERLRRREDRRVLGDLETVASGHGCVSRRKGYERERERGREGKGMFGVGGSFGKEQVKKEGAGRTSNGVCAPICRGDPKKGAPNQKVFL